MTDKDAALRMAAAHVAGVPLEHPHYRLGFELSGTIDDGWLFAYRLDCVQDIPEEEQECFAGAAGFIVSARGDLCELSVPLFIEAQQKLRLR